MIQIQSLTSKYTCTVKRPTSTLHIRYYAFSQIEYGHGIITDTNVSTWTMHVLEVCFVGD